MLRSHRFVRSAGGTRTFTFGLIAAAGLSGCAQPLAVPEGMTPPSVDAGNAPAPASTSPSLPAPPDGAAAPTVAIAEPLAGANVEGPRLTVRGTAKDDRGVASVFLKVGPNVPIAAVLDADGTSWSADVAIAAGELVLEAMSYDGEGRASEPARVSVSWPQDIRDDATPTVTIAAPADGSTPLQQVVLVEGTTADDRGVTRMEVRRNGELLTERVVETADFFAHWARLVPLLPGQANDIELSAYDAAGHKGTARVRLTGRPEADADAPQVAVLSPDPGATVPTDTVDVQGTAYDRAGVREVKVRAGRIAADGSVAFGEYTTATTSDGFGHWTVKVPTPAGALRLEARAIDINGLATTAHVDVRGTFQPQWSEERSVPLRLRDGDPRAELTMDLDRTGVNEVIAPDIQRTIRLLDVDPRPLLTNTVVAIKNACGGRWQEDNGDPRHDCTLTALGRTFGSDWRRSPEYSLVRLLTMTPANVSVDGTSVERLKGLANALGIGGGFNSILADVLGIGRTREVVTTDAVVTALIERWMKTHPALGPTNGAIPVTLFDAMQDLAPVGARLGPSGSHPGVLDPSVTPRSVVFGDGFRMRIVAQSNLRWNDGIVLSRGKDYVATVADTNGGNDVLELDFRDPRRFQIDGLVAAPTMDLRFRILENGAFVPSCVGNACLDNGPAAANRRGPWVVPAHQLESIIAYSALATYESRRGFDKCYRFLLIPCAAHTWVGAGSDPSGWAKFDTVASIGSPPDNQYLWELISEVSQVALHRLPGDVTIPEGQANVAFTVQGIPVGITADQMREAVRPVLEAQKGVISARLLGDYAKNNGPVDLYLSREGATSYLLFVNATDPLPAAPKHTSPGFFGDEACLTKVSEAVPSAGNGAVLRERLAIPATGSRVVYAKDATGAVYRLRVEGAANGGATVTLARRLR